MHRTLVPLLMLLVASCASAPPAPPAAPTAPAPPTPAAAPPPAPSPAPASAPAPPGGAPGLPSSATTAAASRYDELSREVSSTEEALWQHFAAALAERGLSLSSDSERRLRDVIHYGARQLGENANLSEPKQDLTRLAQYLRESVGGSGIVHENNTSAALRRWCPRYPFC
jgi:hypothetical protein